MAKTQGERIATMEAYYAQVSADLTAINAHLAKLNGSVAENSKFRVQQQTAFWVIGVAWASVFIPVVAIAVVLLS